MDDLPPPCTRKTRKGPVVEAYELAGGCSLLVPLIPHWELRQLELERRQRRPLVTPRPHDA